MQLFHLGSPNLTHSETALRHFGTLQAAASRVDNMNEATVREFNGSEFVIRNPNNTEVGRQSVNQASEQLCAVASDLFIYEYDPDIQNPLLLNDCWEDDPIGSGGTDIIDPSSVSNDHRKNLIQLFSPITGIVYPQKARAAFSKNKCKAIKKQLESDDLSVREIQKRKRRSKALGEDWKSVWDYELIWVWHTMQLRKFALAEGFDAFSYINHLEGTGEASFVLLKDEPTFKPKAVWVFNAEKYRDEVASQLLDSLRSLMCIHPSARKTNNDGQHIQVMWAGRCPSEFWSMKQS